jgi:hypothetical protein
MIPGSSPLYGLNTLGGALLLTTKNGFTDKGGSLDVSGGSWGRIQTDADFGVHGRNLGFYAGIGSSYETGWRDYSSSRVQQAFLRGDWRPDEATSIALSYTGAHAKLYGTQALPIEWASKPAAAFTWPDFFVNNLSQFNLQGSRQLNEDWALQANAYLRISQSRSFNSNTNDFDEYDADEDGSLGYMPGGPFDPHSLGRYYYVGLSPAYDPHNPAATINNVVASNVLGNVYTRGFGGSLQAVVNGSLAGHANQLALGVSLDVGDSVFNQSGQPAFFPYEVDLRGVALGLQPFAQDPPEKSSETPLSVKPFFVVSNSAPPSVFRPYSGLEPGISSTLRMAKSGITSQFIVPAKGSFWRTPPMYTDMPEGEPSSGDNVKPRKNKLPCQGLPCDWVTFTPWKLRCSKSVTD